LEKIKPLFKDKDRYFEKDGGPKQCTKCGCCILEVIAQVYMSHTMCESTVICSDCGTSLGYWAYGYWDSDFERAYMEDL